MKKIPTIFTILLLSLMALAVQAQERMNADSLYFVARQYAIDGDYEQSVEISERILEEYPGYYDVRILLARTYAWQNKYEDAIPTVLQVLDEDQKNYDALNALTDFYFWNGDNRASLQTVNKALEYYPEDSKLLVKKAKIQLADNQTDEARETIAALEELDPENESLPLLKKGAGLAYSNMVRLEHYYDTFDKPYNRNWHMSSVAYGRKIKGGDYFARVYWGDLVGDGESLYSDDVGMQFALECYPRIDDYNSMYAAYAYSPDALFPKHRLGLEYYHVFRNRIEISGGYRYMNFSEGLAEAVNVHIATGSIAKYYRKIWVSLRPYIVFDQDETSYIFRLSGRYYLPQEESYLGLTLGTGVSPDNPYFYTGVETIPNLQSFRLEAEWRQKVARYLLFEIQGGFENAEYQNNARRNQLSIRTAIQFMF